MNRLDFRRLAGIRIKEAKALLDRGLYDGAYYLAGYAVECALKACIAKQVRRYEFPEKGFEQKIYTHDLNALLKAGRLQEAHQKQVKADRDFEVQWNVVKLWKSTSRYETLSSLQVVGFSRLTGKGFVKNRGKERARALYHAIANRKHGVLPWLRNYW